jgi:hypothetical protein
LRRERECVGVVCPLVLPPSETEEDQVRAVGLDVHLEFCEVAISEGGEVRSAGRIETKPEQIELFAQSLGAEDRVALEVTGNAWEIARLIERHVARVVVVSPSDTGIRQARAKTDRQTIRHRLDRGGNRQLNCALHRLAINKGKWDPDTASYLERKQAEGKSRKEALRCLKRHLTRRVWKLLHTPPAPASPRTATPTTIVSTAPAPMPCLT